MNTNKFTVETITIPGGNGVSFCRERGGIITSIKLHNKELLYLDEETLQNAEVHVRGGIPILFPNAGPIEDQKFPNLKQHGFARDSARWISEKSENGFKETLKASPETLASYPYKFQLSMEGKFEEDNSLTLRQQVKNLEQDKDLPISMGLHPYFKVRNDEKEKIKFNFENGAFVEQQIDQWANGKAVSVDNPRTKGLSTVLEVSIPDLGILKINASPEYKKIWIWSQPESDFICIEPVMRDVGGLLKNPEMVKPNEVYSAQINFSLS